MVGVQMCVDDDVDAGEIEVLLAQRLEAGIHVGHRRMQLVSAGVDQHARLGMVDDVHVDRHRSPLMARSATKTGVTVIEAGAFIAYRPRAERGRRSKRSNSAPSKTTISVAPVLHPQDVERQRLVRGVAGLRT